MPANRKWKYTLFSILLWIQLVFTVGLGLWRSWDILFGSADIYLGNPSPGVYQFIEFVDRRCPEGSYGVYVSSQFRSNNYFRYELYPIRVSRWSYDWNSASAVNEMLGQVRQFALAREAPVCLIVDHLDAEIPEAGQRSYLNENQYLIVVDG